MIYELKTRLGYQLRISTAVYSDEDDISVNLNITPDFAGYNRNISDDCVVMALYDLLDSISQDTVSYLLTCECGEADDVGIYAPIKSSIVDNRIIWDLPIQDYREILEKPYSEFSEGILRLIFDKEQYKNTVLKIIGDLKVWIEKGIPTEGLTASDFTRSYSTADWLLPKLAKRSKSLSHLPIDVINPYDSRSRDFILDYEETF